jgi:hypothetical protein
MLQQGRSQLEMLRAGVQVCASTGPEYKADARDNLDPVTRVFLFPVTAIRCHVFLL